MELKHVDNALDSLSVDLESVIGDKLDGASGPMVILRVRMDARHTSESSTHQFT